MGIDDLVGCYPAFGGKRDPAPEVWRRFGRVRQYIEPCCFSAAVLLLAPEPASLEVIGDVNGFVANFWRAVKHQPGEVARWADYPVSHIDLGARHVWLMAQRDRLGASLQDPDWPGDAKVAGWWLWGQCCWIGSGWCEWTGEVPHVADAGLGVQAIGKVPHVTDGGQGVQPVHPASMSIQALGKIPLVGNAGRGIQPVSPGEDVEQSTAGCVQALGKTPLVTTGKGVQAMGQIPFLSTPGMGVQASGHVTHPRSVDSIQAMGQIPLVGNAGRGVQPARPSSLVDAVLDIPGDLLTSAGRVAWVWLHRLAARLERVRVIHGDWTRTLNHHYGGDDTAVFLDPPYEGYEGLYRAGSIAQAMAEWARANANLKVALCGHGGDYDMPGWDVYKWSRRRNTYGGAGTKDAECIWFSPACLKPRTAGRQTSLF